MVALPLTHPSLVNEGSHQHDGRACPVSGKTYNWSPPQPGDSRSPCPALNTLANHGYIARDGKNLSIFGLIAGLKAGYNLSTGLATFLVLGGFFLLRRWSFYIDLYDIGLHGRIEHDASLVHVDTPPGSTHAPIPIQPSLVDTLIADVQVPFSSEEDAAETGAGAKVDRLKGSGLLMDATDVARARVRREKESPRLDPLHAEIARGEMAIILGVMERQIGSRKGIPIEWMREWIAKERLHEDFVPTHVQGFWDVVRRAKSILNAMRAQRKAEALQYPSEKSKL